MKSTVFCLFLLTSVSAFAANKVSWWTLQALTESGDLFYQSVIRMEDNRECFEFITDSVSFALAMPLNRNPSNVTTIEMGNFDCTISANLFKLNSDQNYGKILTVHSASSAIQQQRAYSQSARKDEIFDIIFKKSLSGNYIYKTKDNDEFIKTMKITPSSRIEAEKIFRNLNFDINELENSMRLTR